MRNIAPRENGSRKPNAGKLRCWHYHLEHSLIAVTQGNEVTRFTTCLADKMQKLREVCVGIGGRLGALELQSAVQLWAKSDYECAMANKAAA